MNQGQNDIIQRNWGKTLIFFMNQKNQPVEKKGLSEEQKRILRGGETEAPFSGKYVHTKTKGVYQCAGCGAELFSSETKFDSGTGWPSFTDPANRERIKLLRDTSHGMERVEVRCATCDGHLGHVFQDGPGPSGTRYCINSACLNLKPEKNKPSE